MSISNYICVRQRVLPAYAYYFYIKFVKLLRVLLSANSITPTLQQSPRQVPDKVAESV